MEKTLPFRLKQAMDYRGFSNNSLAVKSGIHPSTIKNWLTKETVPDHTKLDKVIEILDINREWLYHGYGQMLDVISNVNRQIKPNDEVDTIDYIELPDGEDELDSIENSFGNKFTQLPNGQYLMYMPLFEWNVAASLLDNDGDTRHPDYENVEQYTTIVDKPLKGKYSAFRVKGASMEGCSVTLSLAHIWMRTWFLFNHVNQISPH